MHHYQELAEKLLHARCFPRHLLTFRVVDSLKNHTFSLSLRCDPVLAPSAQHEMSYNILILSTTSLGRPSNQSLGTWFSVVEGEYLAGGRRGLNLWWRWVTPAAQKMLAPRVISSPVLSHQNGVAND